MTGPSIEFID